MPGSHQRGFIEKEDAIAFGKAARYCASEEHCISEVRMKLKSWGTDGKLAGRIIDQLLKEGFINEQRYAKAFARGKFRNLKWGKVKIESELKKKRIAYADITAGLSEIDPDEYISCLRDLLAKKMTSLKGDFLENMLKTIRFALSKGFETELIQRLLREEDKR